MDNPSTVIIVAIDDSAASRRAIDAACHLAGRSRTLILVHAVDAASVLISIAEGALMDTEPLLEKLMNEGRALCAGALERAREHNVGATSALVDGPAPEAIVRFAVQADAGLIVVGTHARTGLSRMFYGSVAGAIVRTSSIPVVVAHVDDVERTGPIAVAVGGSDPARAAFLFALDSALHTGNSLQMICVRTASER